MIGLKIQNNTCQKALLHILEHLPAEVWQPAQKYEAVLTDDPDVKLSDPVITLGISLEDQYGHIKTPVAPNDLIQKIQDLLHQLQAEAVFENSVFLFQPHLRCLTVKKNGTVIQLTEKESDLLTSLMVAFPTPLNKEDLLKRVWNYRPDTETHTVESHIYALRQKLGTMADALIKSTPEGYLIVFD